jgi:hypothetical protein
MSYTSPILTAPENMVVEANSTEDDGAQVTYTVTAQDNVDGNAMLEEDVAVLSHRMMLEETLQYPAMQLMALGSQ